MINLEWVQPGSGTHDMYPAKSDVDDGAGHTLVTTYALKRPDGQWSLMIVNRDQHNAHNVKIVFDDQSGHTASGFAGAVEIAEFGSKQYQWHAAKTRFSAHAESPSVAPTVAYVPGHADPDGPVLHTKQNTGKDTWFELPAASIVVVRGKIGKQ